MADDSLHQALITEMKRRHGSPQSEDAVKSVWEIAPSFHVLVEPAASGTARLWLPDGAETEVPNIGARVSEDGSRSVHSYGADSLAKGKPTIRLSIETTDHIDDALHFISEICPSASPGRRQVVLTIAFQLAILPVALIVMLASWLRELSIGAAFLGMLTLPLILILRFARFGHRICWFAAVGVVAAGVLVASYEAQLSPQFAQAIEDWGVTAELPIVAALLVPALWLVAQVWLLIQWWQLPVTRDMHPIEARVKFLPTLFGLCVLLFALANLAAAHANTEPLDELFATWLPELWPALTNITHTVRAVFIVISILSVLIALFAGKMHAAPVWGAYAQTRRRSRSEIRGRYANGNHVIADRSFWQACGEEFRRFQRLAHLMAGDVILFVRWAPKLLLALSRDMINTLSDNVVEAFSMVIRLGFVSLVATIVIGAFFAMAMCGVLASIFGIEWFAEYSPWTWALLYVVAFVFLTLLQANIDEIGERRESAGMVWPDCFLAAFFICPVAVLVALWASDESVRLPESTPIFSWLVACGSVVCLLLFGGSVLWGCEAYKVRRVRAAAVRRTTESTANGDVFGESNSVEELDRAPRPESHATSS